MSLASQAITLVSKILTQMSIKGQTGIKSIPNAKEIQNKAIDIVMEMRSKGYDLASDFTPANVKLYINSIKDKGVGTLMKVKDQMSKVEKASDDLGKTLGKNKSILDDVFKNMFLGFTPKVVPKSLSPEKIKRIKGGISTKIKLNRGEENKKYAKELMTNSDEFRQLPDADRKELLDLIEESIKDSGDDVFPFNTGGLARFSFKNGKGLTRRTFLKLMGGLAALPVVGKFLGPATKTVEKAAPVIGEGFKIGKDNFLLLVDKIKRFGKKTDDLATKEREVGYVYSDKKGNTYELIEDISSGDKRIIKDRGGVGQYGEETYDTIEDRTIMELKKGEYVKNKKGKIIKTKDEYYENQEVSNSIDGTFDDVADVADDVAQEVIEEVGGVAIKKKSGGLATMFRKKNV